MSGEQESKQTEGPEEGPRRPNATYFIALVQVGPSFTLKLAACNCSAQACRLHLVLEIKVRSCCSTVDNRTETTPPKGSWYSGFGPYLSMIAVFRSDQTHHTKVQNKLDSDSTKQGRFEKTL